MKHTAKPASVDARPYRVVVVDDHAVVRRGVRALLELHPGIEITGEASNGIEALEIVRKRKPDLVVLDLTMPDMNGLELTRAIRAENDAVEMVVLTMHFSEEVAREALRSGAMAYVLKSDADKDLLTAVDHVRNKLPFFTGQLATSMAQNFVNSPGEDGATIPEGGSGGEVRLTAREIDVITLLAQGKSNKEAAGDLGVSARTVESHRNRIMRKMNFSSFSDLVRFAIRNKIIEP